MTTFSLEKELKENSYPGRGIVIGRSADGKHAVTAYFIMLSIVLLFFFMIIAPPSSS